MIETDRSIVFDKPPAEVWEAMTHTNAYTGWWPWLRSLDAAAGLATGEMWSCHVQPPLPYSLHFTIAIGEVVAVRSVEAIIEGDITGTARVDLSAGEGRTTVVHVVSDLAPAAGALRTFATVARPMVTWGHEWVIDRGIRQFQRTALGGSPFEASR